MIAKDYKLAQLNISTPGIQVVRPGHRFRFGHSKKKMEHLTSYLHRLRIMRLPLSFYSRVMEGSCHSSLFFFNIFQGGLEKAATNEIFLILLSQKEERASFLLGIQHKY